MYADCTYLLLLYRFPLGDEKRRTYADWPSSNQDANPVTCLPPPSGLLSCVCQKRRYSTFYADHTCYSDSLLSKVLSRLTKHCPKPFKSDFLCFLMSTRSVFPNLFYFRIVALRRSRMLFSTFLCLPEDADSNRGGAPITTLWIRTCLWFPFLFLLWELLWTCFSILSPYRAYSRSIDG